MAYSFIYKKRYLKKLEKLLKYLEKDWSKKIADAFLDRLDKHLISIKHNPLLGLATTLKDTRSLIITKHNRLYYRIENQRLIILNLIDTRINPKRNPFKKPT